MKTQTKGFTLIELVVVIVILGILAATALPKFVDLDKEARIKAVQNAAGAIKAASELAHMKCATTPGCIQKNLPTDIPSTKNVQILDPSGTPGYMFNGYPTGKSRRPTAWFGISDWVTVSGLTIDESQSSGPTAYFKLDSAPNPSMCYVKYTESYDPANAPTIITEISGCSSS